MKLSSSTHVFQIMFLATQNESKKDSAAIYIKCITVFDLGCVICYIWGHNEIWFFDN